MDEERIEAAAQVAAKLCQEAIASAHDEGYSMGMLGGDFGVTADERASWDSAPTPEQIAQAVRHALR